MNITLHDAIEQYIVSCKSRLASNTVRIYTGNLARFAQWKGEQTHLSAVSNFDVEQYLSEIITNGAFKETTVQNIANSLRAFFKYWFAHRISNVAWELIKSPRVPERFPDFISEEQFEWIRGYYDEDEYYQLTKLLIFSLLYDTGMRIGELLNLNITDINIQEKHVTILTEKSKKLRVVMWSDETHRLLTTYLGVRISLNKSPELFQTPHGIKSQRKTRLTSRSVQRWCKQLEQELGFRIHPHAFRHGKMHAILNNGGDRHHVQAIAGHSSITSSEIYTRLNLKEQKRLHERFLNKTSKPNRKLKTQFDWLDNEFQLV